MSVEQTTASGRGGNGAVAAASALTPPANDDATLARAPAAARTVTIEAANLDAARAIAAEQLQVPAEQVSLNVIERRKRGLWGLGGEVLTIEATWTPPPPAVPGRVDLSCNRGRLAMTVTRPEGQGKPADMAVFEATLAGLPLDARDEAMIDEALRSPDGRPHVFATIVPSVRPAAEAPVAVKVAGDESAAWLIPWAPEPVTIQAIMNALVETGVTHGVDENVLAAIEGQPLSAPVLIARGKQVVEGVDARPEYLLESLTAKGEPSIGADGRVDFRDIGGQPAVEPGEELVRLVPAIPGEDGYSVRGRPVVAKPVKGFDLKRLAGQNVRVSDDGDALIATAGGLPSRLGERVAVMPIYSVQGDVDFTTGNLDFEGNIMVTGGVRPGFRLRASGGIQIGGTVEAAHVEAGGDVTVNSGIVGHGKAVIRAGGAITARFVEAAELHAGGQILVASELRQTTAISEDRIIVAGPGRIVGGHVRGRESVEAKVLGSSSGTPTSVQAGWGEEMTVEDMSPKRVPKVIAANQVNAGVILTVAGASERFTHPHSGGVWRTRDGKLQYSSS
jgi:hypothetical protein